MKGQNLFTHLEGYGRENFTTEALAYLLESDIGLRRAFIGMLLKEKGSRFQAKFKDYSVNTQIQHGRDRPDMELISCSDRKAKVFVEIKTGSPVGDNQIEHYLNLGHTVLLTPHWYANPPKLKDDEKHLQPCREE
jgi:hypothetical protein